MAVADYWLESPSRDPLLAAYGLPERILPLLAAANWRAAIEIGIGAGHRDAAKLTNILFYHRHPDMVGRKIARGEQDLAREWLSIRDRIVEPTLRALAPTPAGATPLSASRLEWPGASDAQLAFMRAVYERHVGRSQAAGKVFVPSLPRSVLDVIEGRHEARGDAARAARELLAAARSALAVSPVAGRVNVGIVSAYRSADQQFDIWQGKGGGGRRGFPHYYRTTAAARLRLGDEHGAEAADLLAKHIGKYIAAPGFSNHQDGLAIDFGIWDAAGKGGKLSRGSWFHDWLTANAARFHFHPYEAETWHWVYRPPKGTPAYELDERSEATVHNHGQAEEPWPQGEVLEYEGAEPEADTQGEVLAYEAFEPEADTQGEVLAYEAFEPEADTQGEVLEYEAFEPEAREWEEPGPDAFEDWPREYLGEEEEAVAARRGYVASRFALALDGAPAGSPAAFSGGNAYAEVVSEAQNADGIVRKHLGPPRFEPIKLACGVGMSPGFYDWLSQMVERRGAPKSGEIVTIEASGREVSRLGFTNALVTELALPALDAGSRDAGRFSVSLTPEATRHSSKGSGVTAKGGASPKPKQWIVGNFRLAIDGLDCRRVSRIEPLVIRQVLSEAHAGTRRSPELIAAQVDVPSIVATLPEADASTWMQWFEQAVIKGAVDERNGKLEILTPDLKAALFELTFAGVGPYRLAPVPAAGEGLRKVQASMYCEQMTLRVPSVLS